MFPRGRKSISALLITSVVLFSISGCRNRQPVVLSETEVEPTGEPEVYSATVVRTIVDGSSTETVITHFVKSGEKTRQEWTEEDNQRALIWRPDLGKSFLLDLDKREFQEIAGESSANSQTAGARAGLAAQRSPDLEKDRDIQTIDQHLDDAQSPTTVEIHTLPEVVIEGHQCSVYEERSSFLDGHTEVTRRFRARDLAGLALKVETSVLPAGVTVTTERRDVRLEASSDEFVVPADFKRVDVVR